MNQPIYKLTGYTEKEYETFTYKLIFNWCDIYSQGSDTKMQMLIASRQINNWFHAEYKKLLKQFRTDLAEAELRYKTTTKDRRQLFTVTMTKIYGIYPKVLMQQTKSTITDSSINKKFSNN